MTIKNFKPMECPICHQYYFSDDTDLEKEDSEYEGKEDDYCSHCGWKYDLYQIEHPDVPNLTNELSLNDYKKWFQSKIDENPKYDLNTHIPQVTVKLRNDSFNFLGIYV